MRRRWLDRILGVIGAFVLVAMLALAFTTTRASGGDAAPKARRGICWPPYGTVIYFTPVIKPLAIIGVINQFGCYYEVVITTATQYNGCKLGRTYPKCLGG